MDLSTRCPQCGRKHIYFSHEVGTEAPCRACGQAIELRPQKSVETIRIVLAVLGFIGLIALIWWRATWHTRIPHMPMPVPPGHHAPDE